MISDQIPSPPLQETMPPTPSVESSRERERKNEKLVSVVSFYLESLEQQIAQPQSGITLSQFESLQKNIELAKTNGADINNIANFTQRMERVRQEIPMTAIKGILYHVRRVQPFGTSILYLAEAEKVLQGIQLSLEQSSAIRQEMDQLYKEEYERYQQNGLESPRMMSQDEFEESRAHFESIDNQFEGFSDIPEGTLHVFELGQMVYMPTADGSKEVVLWQVVRVEKGHYLLERLQPTGFAHCVCSEEELKGWNTQPSPSHENTETILGKKNRIFKNILREQFKGGVDPNAINIGLRNERQQDIDSVIAGNFNITNIWKMYGGKGINLFRCSVGKTEFLFSEDFSRKIIEQLGI